MDERPQMGRVEGLANEAVHRRESERIQETTITQLDYGYIVRVGCNSFAVEDREDLLRMINAYILQPRKVFEDWTVRAKLPK